MIEFFPRGEIGIFPQFVFYPGKVSITEQVEIIFSLADLFENIGMTFAENKFTPDLHYIHICINE